MGCTCTKMYHWKKKDKNEPPSKDYQKLLNTRREEMLTDLECNQDSEIELTESFIEEWIALTKERDELLWALHKQELKHELCERLVHARFWMKESLGALLLCHDEFLKLPKEIKLSLQKTLVEVDEFLTANPLPMPSSEATSRSNSLEPAGIGANLAGVAPVDVGPLGPRENPSGEEDDGHCSPTAASKSAGGLGTPSPHPKLLQLMRMKVEGTVDEYRTPFDAESVTSHDTFESAFSNNYQLQNAMRFFPNAFSHRLAVAQRLATVETDGDNDNDTMSPNLD